MNQLQRISSYGFIITILWIGFVLAISVMETPLRFQPEQVSQVEALSIGRLVFHALNIVEMVFALLLVIACCAGNKGSRSTAFLMMVIVLMLVAQTILLFTVLDERTAAILRGEEVPKAIYHSLYVGLDFLKLILLVSLATVQIRQFKTAVRNRTTVLEGNR